MNICIVDDHILIRQALKNLLTELNPNTYTINIYKSAEEFLAEDFDKWRPELVIADMILTGMSGLEMIRESKKKLPNTKFLALSAIADIPQVKDSLRKGIINGYVTKDASEEELLEAIQTVMQGNHYINRSLKDRLLDHLLLDEVTIHLSMTEKEILNRLCTGSTPKEIAYEMELNIHSVQRYIKNLFRKFDVKRTTELVLVAIRRGLYTPVQK